MFKQIGMHFFLEDKASVLAQQSEIFSVDREMRDKILQKFMNLYRKSFSQEMLFWRTRVSTTQEEEKSNANCVMQAYKISMLLWV